MGNLEEWRKQAPENDLKKSILDWCVLSGHIAIRLNNVRFTGGGDKPVRFLPLWAGQKGAADIFLFIGRPYSELIEAIAIETKKVGEKLSSDQRNWRDRWITKGGRYVCARRLEDVENCVEWREWPIE